MVNGGLGMAQTLFLNVDINMPGMEKFDELTNKIKTTEQMSNRANNNLTQFNGTIEESGNKAENTGGQFGQMFGVGMNLMFMGMALQQVFGGLAGTMLETTGATATFGAAAKSTLLPFFTAITPLLNKVAFLFMDLPRPIKMALGAFVALLAVLGTFMFFGAQVALLAISLQVSLLSLAGAILTVVTAALSIFIVIASIVYIFEKFGIAAGAVAATVGGALLVAFLEFIGATNLAALGIYNLTGATSALTLSMYGLEFSMLSILLIAGALAASILIMQKVFKEFGVVAGALAGALAAGLLAVFAPIAGAIMAAVGAVMTINKAFKKFGNVIGTIATLIIAGVALFLAPIIGLPAAVGIAVAAAIAWFWNMKEEISKAIQNTIDFILAIPEKITTMKNNFIRRVKTFFGDVKKWFGKIADQAINKVEDIVEWFKNLPSKLTSAASDIASKVKTVGEDIMNGIADGIKNAPDAIMDAIKEVAPDWVIEAMNKAGGAAESAGEVISSANPFTSSTRVNDFILTGDGALETHPQDTLIGTTGDPSNIGGEKTEVNVEINDPVMKEEADIEDLVDEVEDRVNRSTRGRTGIT